MSTPTCKEALEALLGYAKRSGDYETYLGGPEAIAKAEQTLASPCPYEERVRELEGIVERIARGEIRGGLIRDAQAALARERGVSAG